MNAPRDTEHSGGDPSAELVHILMRRASVSTPIERRESPRLIYGTAWKKERTAELVALALGEGFRAIDTACQPKHYDEARVGEAVATFVAGQGTRAELYLQTKFTPVDGQDPARIPYDPSASISEQVRQSCDASLRNLRTDYLDGLILHSPLRKTADTREVWRAMEALVDRGVVRRLGISNCYELAEFERIFAAARIKPAVLQNRFHQQTNYDRDVREYCRRQGVTYQSFWTLTANPHLLEHSMMASLTQRHGRTPAQILFRYLTQQGVTPLTGTTSRQHMREDLAICEFELSPAECRAIDALL